MSVDTKINPFEPRIFGDAFARSSTPVAGMEFPDFKSLGLVLPIGGGAKGYSAAADVLTQTPDGRDLNEIWSEFQATLRIVNEKRAQLVGLLTYPVTNLIEDVPSFSGDDFEEASEYGVPKSIRPTGDLYQMGYTFKWYDVATRFTWQFLAEASAAQVEAIHQSVLDADNRLVFKEIMKTLFRPTNRLATIKGQNYNVYSFWNGDGIVPPSYKNTTFSGTHTHYRNSGNALIDSGDLEEIIDDFKSHGYSTENGTTMFVLMNQAQADLVRPFRAQTANNNGAIARWDFIPAQGSPTFIVPNAQGIIGGQVPNTFRGLNVIGNYGPLLIIEESYIPVGYLVALTTGGTANLQNPIGLREHANASLRGLRLVKGKEPDYPLIDSYYVRGFGTGVRQRGAGLIMKLGATAYAAPVEFS